MAREYKDSGIEWIGKIPKEWKIAKYKFFANSRMGETILNEDTSDEGIPIYSATQDSKIFGYINNPKLLLKKGDIVIPARGNSIGCISIVKEEIATCTQTTICSRNIHGVKSLFLYYTAWGLKDYWFRYDGSAIPQITVNQVNNNVILLPPLSEQQKIADYLDKVCGEADEMIALQEKMIEELKAYKQSVITEAVTKGLNPNVPMKNSGIDWIGEIPKHWRKSAVKHIITKIESGVSVNAELIKAENNELGVLKTSSVSSYYFIPSENKRVDLEEYNRVRCPVKADTIIVSRMNTPELVGAAGYCSQDIPTIFLPDRLWQVNFDKSKLFVKFGWYYLISSPIKAYYSSLSSGTSSSMQNISQPQFCQAFFLLPPISEQQQIVSYLDVKCSDTDSLIAVKQQKIEELKEYKKSVIYEYVTGKKEVI